MGDNTLPHVLDNTRQLVAAYMRMRLVQHIICRTKMMEQLHHSLHVTAFLAAGKEFAVGECACAAFAKTVV